MSGEDALDARGIANLWAVIFGQPPAIIDDPALMLGLIEEHLERRALAMGQGPEEGVVERNFPRFGQTSPPDLSDGI